MKKLCLLLCCTILLSLFCACSAKNEDFQQPVNFYYSNVEIGYNSPTAVIKPEIREGAFYNDNVEQLLEDYLAGPREQGLHCAVPDGTKLIHCNNEECVVHIMFSEEFAELSGIELSVCCSCILRTLHEYADIHTVHISAMNAQLDDELEFVLNIDDIVLMDSV